MSTAKTIMALLGMTLTSILAVVVIAMTVAGAVSGERDINTNNTTTSTVPCANDSLTAIEACLTQTATAILEGNPQPREPHRNQH